MKPDHIVYFTRLTPEQVVAQQHDIGRHVVVGGSHGKWGTCNALFYTSNVYVEWLSVENFEVAMVSGHPLTKLLLHDIKSGDGWGTICFSVQDIGRFDKELKEKGFKSSGIIDGQRKTPEGTLKKWRMLFVMHPNADQLPFPFFIEWGQSEVVRLAGLRKNGTILPSNEKIEVSKCVFESANPLKDLQQWRHLLSCETVSDNQLSVSNVILQFEKLKGQKKERLRSVLYTPLNG